MARHEYGDSVLAGGIRYTYGARGRITADLGPFQMTGKSRSDVTEAVTRMAREAVTYTYAPAVLTYAGRMAIVYREPLAGWGYRITTAEEANDAPVLGQSVQTANDRDDAIKAARLDLAQRAYDDGHNGLDFLTGDARLEHCRWLAFQRAYKIARASGQSDMQAHRFACDEMSNAGKWLSREEWIEALT